MDPNQGLPQAAVVPVPEDWAAGVRVPVSPRSKRMRWGIAVGVVLCVAIITVTGAFVLSGAVGSKSLTASVAPRNTVAFLTVRTDLPGDQHAKLADFMSHFPGFKDRGQFNTALDELLNKLTGAVSPDFTYTSAFKPWMEGEASIALTSLGTPGALIGNSNSGPSLPGAIAIFALKDHAAAQNWIDGELSRNSVKTTAQEYAGTKLYTFGATGNLGAYAFTDQDLVMGTVDGVKGALDTKTMGSLADNPNYQAAMGMFSGDSLAGFYIDPRAIVGGFTDLLNGGSRGGPLNSSPMATLPVNASNVPAWIAGSIRAESDRMVVDVLMPRVGDSGAGNYDSRLVPSLPGDTVAVVEVHSIGKMITDQLAAYEAMAPGDASIKSIKDALSLIDGVDWLGDGVAVLTRDGSTLGGGVVAEAKDASTASGKVALLSTMISLGGGSLNLSSRDETYKGVDITLVSVASNPVSTVGSVEIGFAAVGKLIVAGYGDAFVKAVIDTTPSTSLASQPDYKAVMAALGSSSEQSAYVNIPALEDQLGQSFFSVTPSKWNLDYKPYFDHVGGVGYSVVDGNTVILRFVVTAK